MAVTNALRPLFKWNRRMPSALTSYLRFNSSLNDPNILKSPLKDVEIPKISVSELVFSQTEKWGNLVAMECGITGRNYTYDQLRIFSINFAVALRKKLKLNKNDVVAILLPNCPEFAIAILGTMHGGMIATTLNPMYTPGELCRQLVDSGAKALITIVDLWPNAKAAVNLAKLSIPILAAKSKEDQSMPEGAICLKEMLQNSGDLSGIEQPSYEDIAILPYSSGTTGLPKGVMLTHHNIVSNLMQCNSPEVNYLYHATSDHQDIVPVILPQFHIYGLVVSTFLTSLRCCKHVCLPRFEPKLFIETLVKQRPHVLFVAPPLIMFLSSHDAVKPEYLSPIRLVVSGAAPLGAADEEKFLKKANTDINISQGYGMTESSPVLALKQLDKSARPGSTGPPVPNTEIKIVDINNPSGPALGPNETGELVARGPQIMKGYLNKPEETQSVLVDGWLRTGDMAFYDEGGNLTITDRLKELIKVKGFQVPPAELEEVIREYPDVLEVGVIGIEDERCGQVPKAFVVVKPGCKLDKDNLQDYVKSRVASYKELKGGVAVIDVLPKNQSGKILRRELQKYHESQ